MDKSRRKKTAQKPVTGPTKRNHVTKKEGEDEKRMVAGKKNPGRASQSSEL